MLNPTKRHNTSNVWIDNIQMDKVENVDYKICLISNGLSLYFHIFANGYFMRKEYGPKEPIK